MERSQARQSILVFAATVILASSAGAIGLDRSELRIRGLGTSETFIVDATEGCSVAAVASDSRIASVRPVRDAGGAREFAVRAIEPGTTAVDVRWGGERCVAPGSQSLLVTIEATGPNVVLLAYPQGLVSVPGAGTPADQFILQNIGDQEGDIVIQPTSSTSSYFTISPTRFPLAPGASRAVNLGVSTSSVPKILPKSDDAFTGSAIVNVGLFPAVTVPLRQYRGTRPLGTVIGTAPRNRADVTVSASDTQNSSGAATFMNSGTATLRGIAVSDVPWLIPQETEVVIQPGQSRDVTFTIDRRTRPASEQSAVANLSLLYVLGSQNAPAANARGPLSSPGAGSASVSVVSTSRPPVIAAPLPGIDPNEVRLFVPGVGNILGSVGQFISDLSFINLLSDRALTNVQLYYTPAGSSETKNSMVKSLATAVATSFGDIIGQLFRNTQQIGTLQIKSIDTPNLSISANVFNSSNPAGTFGTSIPVFRSDRAISGSGRAFLTGLRSDANSHTNVFVQETTGNAITVNMEYFDAGGNRTGSTDGVAVGAFGVVQATQVLPAGAVAAVVSLASGNGAFVSYATPVDRLSGDTWAIADWAKQGAFTTTEPVAIPVAGAAQGANNTYFRTDVAIMNVAAGTATGTLTYFPGGGSPVTKNISLAQNQTQALTDVTTVFFGVPAPTIGYIEFRPTNGQFALSSRNYTTLQGSAATFGTAIPVLPLSKAMTAGESRKFGGLEDSSATTVGAARPATFRSNFGIVETSGQPVTVRLTMNYTFPGQLAAVIGTKSVDYNLNPNQTLLISNISKAVLGDLRNSFGDMRGLQAEFSVVGGTGKAMVFVSSIDNGTGDSVLQTY
ncbi:MAG: hypothetical protein ACSLFQ_12190 [Thermoanaerobaculia bacterium]